MTKMTIRRITTTNPQTGAQFGTDYDMGIPHQARKCASHWQRLSGRQAVMTERVVTIDQAGARSSAPVVVDAK